MVQQKKNILNKLPKMSPDTYYKLSEELSLHFLGLEELNNTDLAQKDKYRLHFEVLFPKFDIRDPYYVELWRLDAFFKTQLENIPPEKNLSFDRRNKHYIYLTKEALSLELIELLIQYLLEKIGSYLPSVFLPQELEAEYLYQSQQKRRLYRPEMFFEQRNFSVRIDTFMKYDEECLENYAYQIMRDYMDRREADAEILSIENAPNNPEVKNISARVRFLLKKQPSFTLKFSFYPEQTALSSQEDLVLPLTISPQLFQLKKFVLGKAFNQEEISRWLSRIVRNGTEAIPPEIYGESLEGFFDIEY